jgi:two-component system sensor histidine kinase ArlS
VKYSAERPTVRIAGMKRGRTIRIEVTDYGIGIATADLDRVFDRFYRVDKARSRERGGTGLGLAIAKRLVERNRGEIAMESAEQRGTTVTLMFPAV